jgi:multiple sugar transport system substrate-binding protein
MKLSARWVGVAASIVVALAACQPVGSASPTPTATNAPPATTTPTAPPATATAAAVVEIEFWNYWDGNNGEAIGTLAQEYNDSHPNIRVKPVTFPWGDLLPKFQTAIAGNSPPAAGAADIAWRAKLHASEALIDLNTAIQDAGVDLGDFYPALLEYGKNGDQLGSVPVSTNNLALFYNKDLFTQAGLDPDSPPTTWEELRDDAKAIAALGNGVQGFEIYTQPGEGLTWQFQPYLWQAGGEYLTDNYTKPGFNNDAGKQALGFLVDLIQKDHVAEAGQWGAFDTGNAGMRVDGSWMVGVYAEQAPFEFGTAMLPIPDGGQHATNMGGEQAFVFKTTPEQEAAATEFVLWLTSTDVQAKWDTLTSFMPIRKSVLDNADLKAWAQGEPRFQAFVEQQQYAHARPPIDKYADTSDAFSRALEPAFYGQVSVDEALANAEQGVLDALK